MFLIAAVVILLVSFIIALLSLFREQKKVARLSEGMQVPKVTLQESGVDKETVTDETESTDTQVADLMNKPQTEKAFKKSRAARVDEETAPFPWEIDVQSRQEPESIPIDVGTVSEPVMPMDMKGYDSVATPAGQASTKLYPKHASPTGPMQGLSGSISLKDLKK